MLLCRWSDYCRLSRRLLITAHLMMGLSLIIGLQLHAPGMSLFTYFVALAVSICLMFPYIAHDIGVFGY